MITGLGLDSQHKILPSQANFLHLNPKISRFAACASVAVDR